MIKAGFTRLSESRQPGFCYLKLYFGYPLVLQQETVIIQIKPDKGVKYIFFKWESRKSFLTY